METRITPEYKEEVYKAMMIQRRNFGGTNGQFAKMYGLSGSVFTRYSQRRERGRFIFL